MQTVILIYRHIDTYIICIHKVLNNKFDCPQLLQRFNLRVPRCLPRTPITTLAVPSTKSVLGSNSPIPRLSKLLNSLSTSMDIHEVSIANLRNILLKS